MWFLVALVPPLLWSAGNHFDKYLVSRRAPGRGMETLFLFSTLVAGATGLLAGAVSAGGEMDVPGWNEAPLVLSGVLYSASLWGYFRSLEIGEPEVVAGLAQMVPFFNWALASLFLGERLSALQGLGCALVVAGVAGLSVSGVPGRGLGVDGRLLGLVAASSLLTSMREVLFKLSARSADGWRGTFWMSLGIFLSGLAVLLLVPSWRRPFLEIAGRSGRSTLLLYLSNEVLGLLALLSFNWALLLAPVTVVSSLGGLQSPFAFLIALAAARLYPDREAPAEPRALLLRKGAFVLVVTAGSIVLGRS